jgi:hypothetical protein
MAQGTHGNDETVIKTPNHNANLHSNRAGVEDCSGPAA